MDKKQIGIIKRQINTSLKKAGFVKNKHIGYNSNLFGSFKVEDGDYIMANQNGVGGIIFIPSSKYIVNQIISEKDYFKNIDQYNGTAIHKYLGDPNQVAIATYHETTSDEQNQMINKIYNHLQNNGFSDHIVIKDGFNGNTIIIKGA